MYVAGTVDRLLRVELNFTTPGITGSKTNSWSTFFCPCTSVPRWPCSSKQKVDLNLIMTSVLSHHLSDKKELCCSSNVTEHSRATLQRRLGRPKWVPASGETALTVVPFTPSAQCHPYQHLHACRLRRTCRHPLDSTYAFPHVAGANSYSRLLSISINAAAGALPTGSLMCHCRDYTACISTFISLALHVSLSCHCPIALFSDSLTDVL